MFFVGFGLSPSVFGSIFTFVVNPDNKNPSDSEKNGAETTYYFSEEVYDRVPLALIYMSGAILAV